MTLSIAQFRSLVQAVKRKADRPFRYVGVHAAQPWTGESSFEVEDEAWSIAFARSSFEARRIIVQSSDRRVLLLTPLRESDLGGDVLARFPFPRIESIQPWEAVREAFSASRIDPRVVRLPWLAAELLDRAPAAGFPPVGGGLLDLDAAWAVLQQSIGLAPGRPSIADVLRVSADGMLQGHWSALSDALRGGFAERLESVLGEVGRCLAGVLDAGRGDELLPLGLIVDLLSRGEATVSPVAVAVRTRMEQMGVRPGEWHGIATWGSEAARECAAWLAEEDPRVDRALAQGDALVDALGASALVSGSSLLAGGLVARRAAFAKAIEAFVQKRHDERRPEAVEQTAAALESHQVFSRRARFAGARRRVRDAVRLARWLAREPDSASTLEAAARQYQDHGAWADRARHVLLAGEGDAEFTKAFAALAEAALAVRERENREFATRLQSVCAGSESAGAVILLESVMANVVAPLAEKAKVLLIVMDGMSHPVFQQIAESLVARRTLDRQTPASVDAWPPVLTPLPSVTEVCRASLLSGALARGGQNVERDGFEGLAAQHKWRATATAKGILFHKGDLEMSGGGLASALRDSMVSGMRVVAAVVNAVDDQLGKGDQLRPQWSLETVPVLEQLVSLAEVERRVIVLVADHGHVVDLGHTEKRGSDQTNERWCAGDRAPMDDEVAVTGNRVVADGAIIVPCGERVRYVARKAGYHGGATAQEVIAPLAVFVPVNVTLDGWSSESLEPPAWWTGEAERPTGRPVVAPAVPITTETTLFEAAITPAAPSQVAEWIEQLLSSKMYESQRAVAGRTPPTPAEVRAILDALDQAGGSLTFDALRTRVRTPDLRLRGQIVAISRMLNIDGFVAFEIDQGSKTVRLNLETLRAQFLLQGGAT